MPFKFVPYGDSRLHEKAETVTSFDESVGEAAMKLTEALLSEQAFGLAAQHVGLRQRMCGINILEHSDSDGYLRIDGATVEASSAMPLILVNPKMEVITSEVFFAEEGSVSFPGISGKVGRGSDIIVNYQDIEGNQHELHCNGLVARCIQHEVDQLEGILFIERMDTRTLQKLLPKLKQLKRRGKKALK